MNIRRMTLDDIPQVLEIERASFALPWSENAFRKELTENAQAHFFVAEENDRVVGILGYWYIIDECHISTIAVHPDWRQRGIGQEILVAALSHSLSLGAIMATLEVRPSNLAAIELYKKFGFEVVGRRKRYYRDNGEDAIIMTAQPIRLTMEN
jgi:[ribosomal protein S18]-alanine N-acetyltransferase